MATQPPSGSVQTAHFTDVLQSLACKGADMNAADSNGLTPLHCALLARNIAAATALLQISEVSVRPRTPDGETPYDIAARLQLTSIGELLSRLGGHLVTERRASLPRSPSPDKASTLGVPSLRTKISFASYHSLTSCLERRPSAPVVKQGTVLNFMRRQRLLHLLQIATVYAW